MRALIVYDSVFGNTERVARAMGEALVGQAEVEVQRAGDVAPERLAGLDVLIVGSPTRAFSPTPAITRLLKRIPKGGLEGVRVVAFDTRFAIKPTDPAILRGLVRLFGYAAEPISKRLVRMGGTLAASPEGFIVVDTEGPLKEGELERAAGWVVDGF